MHKLFVLAVRVRLRHFTRFKSTYVRVLRERAVLGGAANVAANLKAVGAEPAVVGTLQNDVAGERLLRLLAGLNIHSEGIVQDASRPTIIKTRVIGQQQQMLRIDREDKSPLDVSQAAVVLDLIRAHLATADAIVSGLAPGNAACTMMVGKSTCGSGATGSCR